MNPSERGEKQVVLQRRGALPLSFLTGCNIAKILFYDYCLGIDDNVVRVFFGHTHVCFATGSRRNDIGKNFIMHALHGYLYHQFNPASLSLCLSPPSSSVLYQSIEFYFIVCKLNIRLRLNYEETSERVATGGPFVSAEHYHGISS